MTLRHVESGGVGYNNGYTTLEAFLSADPNFWKATPFFDARAHLFDDGKWAANGGIGMRGQLGDRIYGISAYYDYRGTKHLHYNQASVGFESLGERIDARINGYFPFSKQTSSPYDTEFGYFSGHYLYLSQKVEFAMTGADAEVGFHLGSCDSWNLYAALGPYYFRGPGGPNAWGGKVRASLSYQSLVAFDVIESYDNVFHNKLQGQIGFSIPLGRKNAEIQIDKLYCRKIQPVARNEIVVLSTKHKYPTATNPQTNLPYYFVFVDNTSSSDGTFESPYPSLSLAENNSASNQIIYTFPGDGTTTNMDQGITLKPSQKFWGSGLAHNLQTEQGSITIPQMSQNAPQITNSTLLGAGTTLSTNNEVSGITFTQTSGQAITGTDPIGVSISFCTFTACGQGDLGIYPVVLQASTPLTTTFMNNNFTSNPNAGAFVKLLPGASCSVAMNNNQASTNEASSGSAALLNIEAHGAIGSCELVMANNVFQNNECGGCSIIDFDSPHEGSFSSFQGTFTDNIFTNGKQGITFATNADICALSIQNNDLSSNTNGSILVTAGAAGTQLINQASIVIDSNQINEGGNQGDAITISPSGTTLSIAITNNSISDNIGTGFVSYINSPYPDATLFITNNVITNNENAVNFNASGGISFDGMTSLTASIEENTFSHNAQGNSIGAYTPPTDASTVSFLNNQLTSDDTFNFIFHINSPQTSCLTMTGNASTTDPAYIVNQIGSGSCFLVPCDYLTENTGGFSLADTITPSANCAGTACP